MGMRNKMGRIPAIIIICEVSLACSWLVSFVELNVDGFASSGFAWFVVGCPGLLIVSG